MNIKRYAYLFKMLCMLLIPVVFLSSFSIFFSDNFTNSTYGLQLAHLGVQQKTFLLFVQLIGTGIVIYGLLILINIARNFQYDRIFTKETTNLFIQLKKKIVFLGFYKAIQIVLFFNIASTTFTTPMIAALLSATSIIYFFIFIFLSLLAIIISKAQELQCDHDLTV